MIEKVIELLRVLQKEKFTGSIEVHFSEGGVAKVVRHETVR